MDEPTMFARLRDLRERVLARVRQVNTTTENKVLATGGHVQRVVEVAYRHIATLRGVLSGPVGNEDSELARAIRTQTAHVRDHASRVSGAVAAQATQVAAVATQVRAITEAAREIERLNAAARVLSINARIEASRATGSAVFRAIASEMQQLSKAIAHANKTVYDLSATMAKAVPELVHHNRALAHLVDGYATEAGERIEAVDRQVTELRAAVSTTLAESDDALAQIVDESHAALSDLQFQDVCAQGLLQVDTWVATLAREIAAELGLADDLPPSAHATVGDDDIQLARRDAGEVVLF
jgi:hypothetical protein